MRIHCPRDEAEARAIDERTAQLAIDDNLWPVMRSLEMSREEVERFLVDPDFELLDTEPLEPHERDDIVMAVGMVVGIAKAMNTTVADVLARYWFEPPTLR